MNLLQQHEQPIHISSAHRNTSHIVLPSLTHMMITYCCFLITDSPLPQTNTSLRIGLHIIRRMLWTSRSLRKNKYINREYIKIFFIVCMCHNKLCKKLEYFSYFLFSTPSQYFCCNLLCSAILTPSDFLPLVGSPFEMKS